MKLIKQIWAEILQQKKAIFFVYLIQLLLSFVVGFKSYSALHSSIGHSTSLNHLAKGFDITVLRDMMNVHGQQFEGVQTTAAIIICIYLLLSVFLHGGLLGNIVKEKKGLGAFFEHGRLYFLPFLGFSLIFICILAIDLAILYGVFFKVIGDPLVFFDSEKGFVLSLLGISCIGCLAAIFIWSWSISTRCNYINGLSFFNALKIGAQKVVSSLRSFVFLGLCLLALHILLACVYLCFNSDFGATSWVVIIGVFLIQQIFTLFRVGLRAAGYSGVKNLTL